MVALIIQTVLLLAIAFIVGAVIGCLLRKLFGSEEAAGTSTTAASKADSSAKTATGSGTAKPASVELANKTAAAPMAPLVPKPPTPTAPVQVDEKPELAKAPAAPVVAKTPQKAAKAKPAAKAPAASKKPAAKKAPAQPRKTPAKPAAATGKDDLKKIRGIGPQNEERLNKLGVTRFAQIAAWSAKQQGEFGDALAFPGRIERENWVDQAKVLAKGGQTEFAKRVESGDVDRSLSSGTTGDVGSKPDGTLSAARGGNPDDLTQIDGVGNAIEKKMFNMGIYHFDQIAGMSKAELTWLGNAVGFPGRPERENWAGESKSLAAGGATKTAAPKKRGIIKSKRKS